jgi:predicted nucleic acid-binding Zn ribbon protein
LKRSLTLCRLALAQGVGPAASAEKTRVLDAPQEAAAPADGEKTRVFERPQAAAPAPPPKPAPPAAPPPVAAPAAPAPPKSASGLRFRYCPSCTTANPPDATVCSRCGTRLAEGGPAPAKTTNWGMWIAVGVAAVLGVVLVLVLVMKR